MEHAVIHILGLDPVGDLPPCTATLLADAQYVVGAATVLESLDIPQERRLPMGRDMADLAAIIRQHHATGATVVVLGSGDPLFFGIGASLVPQLGDLPLMVHPSTSSLQLLAARLHRPWHNWRVVSLHGRDDTTGLLAALTHAAETLILTDPGHDPAWIARLLLARGAGEAFCLHVGECLGRPGERLRSLSLAKAAGTVFQHPNLVLAERLGPGPTPAMDEAWVHGQGPVSKPATRALALTLLAPGPEATFWDVGAGSGAVAFEAAAHIPQGAVFALERDPTRLAALHANRARARAWMVEIIPGDLATTAPNLPRPSHIFWGGGTHATHLRLLADCLAPGGRLVVSFVRLEVFEILRQHAPQLGLTFSLHHLQHSVGQALADGLRLVPHNPVFLALLEKPQ